MLTRFATVEDARADIASSPLAERRFDVRKDDNGFYVCVRQGFGHVTSLGAKLVTIACG